jgi:hypothetical protein
MDGMTIEAFEHNLSRNLYKIWNRLSLVLYAAAGEACGNS